MSRSPLAVMVVAALALALSACGSGSEDTSSTSGAKAAPTAASAPASTSASPAGSSTSTGASTGTATAPAQNGASASHHSSSSSGSSGSSSTSSRPSTSSTPSSTAKRYPHGDNSIQTYGQQADAAETQAVGSTVKSYYAALAAGDGARACSLLAARLSKSLVQGLGRSPTLRNKGCSGIIALLFKHRSGHSNAQLTAVEVTSVRVKGDHGFALLHSKTMPTGEMVITREGGVWKVGSLIGSSL